MNDAQGSEWAGDFGQSYTARNPQTFDEMDAHYKRTFGISRTALNERFLDHIDRACSALEVGTNVGVQLEGLHRLGFSRLTGVEIQRMAIERAHARLHDIGFVQGAGQALPFRDRSFDLVFTSGVLIHVSPQTIEPFMLEVHRCSARYIWGWEYYAESHRSIPYRGHDNLLWKGDFARMYLERFGDLRLVREERVQYLSDSNVDSMFLLEKRL